MRMGFLFTGLFWGGILVLIGLSVILKAVFHIHFPVVRVIFGLIVIYFGVRLLMGGGWCRMSSNTVMFEESNVVMTGKHDEYSVVFGKATVDAAGDVTPADRRIRVNTVFGQSTIRINSSIPTLVKVSSAFAGARLPDGNLISFGEYTYRNAACRNAEPLRRVHVNVVFGGCDIVEQPGPAAGDGANPQGPAAADSSMTL